MDARMTLTQEQIQKLSAMQIQSLQILSMSSEDLRSLLQKESEENPFLDYHPSSSRGGAAEFLQFVAAPDKDRIKNFLIEQLNPSQFTKPQWALLNYLAQCVDDQGYLTVTEQDVSRFPLPDGLFSQAVAILQGLHPPGIGASSLQECLKLQLRRKGELTPLAETLVDSFLEDIGKNHIAAVCRALGLPKQQVLPTIRRIRALDPAPLKGLFDSADAYVVPDVIIRPTEGEYEIILNDTWFASYSMSDYYIAMMHQADDPDIKTYFQQKHARCSLLLHNIERRRQTLAALTGAIWEWQREYLETHHALRPMTLKDMAEKTGLHISTISRAIKDKYVQTPYRTLPFKALFQCPLRKDGQSLSKDAVKKALCQLIREEDKERPYSDAQLVEMLSAQFHTAISRRVVQKYRSLLHIPNSYARKIQP
ncbi:RNA polymerase sigma-54 factor [Megasphaera sp. ASD88]|nr:RNA polymerase sigma-54 factor [Megasphaera sp. ASD88]